MNQPADTSFSLPVAATDAESALRELLRSQRWCPGEAGHGACVSPMLDLPDASAGGTPNMIAAFLLLWAAKGGESFLHGNIGRMEAAAESLLRMQRSSGRLDLISCNPDSGPDTAFSAIPICLGIEHLVKAGFPAELKMLRDTLETFLRHAAHGLITGGIHTPNHRWVVTSALLLLQKLFPDLDARPTADAYLAETFDIDDEGFFIERSAGVYDAVCDRSLFIIDRCIGLPAAREAALRNLRLNLNMLSEDGTIETELSHRQDFGKRTSPASLAGCFLRAYELTGEAPFYQAARSIHAATISGRGEETHVAAVWTLHAFLLGVPEPPESLAPDAHLLRGTIHLPGAGYWRASRPGYTVAAFRGGSHLLSFRAGTAEISSLQIAQAYMGIGQFLSDEMRADDGGVRLINRGQRQGWPAPGYRRPLGKAVSAEHWADSGAERNIVPMPAPGGVLDIRLEDHGLALTYSPDKIPDGVPGQVALDFPAGGIWECDGARLAPAPGQVVFLKSGTGRMIYGHDAIEIGPGQYGHGWKDMRDARSHGNLVRVLLTFLSPHPHYFFIRYVPAF